MNLNRVILSRHIRPLMWVWVSSALTLALASGPVSKNNSLTVGSKEEWANRRAETLRNLQSVMGDLPEKSSAPLDLRILEEERVGTITRQKITFVSEVFATGPDRVSAYLLVPAGSQRKKTAGVLCLHQTTKIGKGEPAGLGGKPDL